MQNDATEQHCQGQRPHNASKRAGQKGKTIDISILLTNETKGKLGGELNSFNNVLTAFVQKRVVWCSRTQEIQGRHFCFETTVFRLPCGFNFSLKITQEVRLRAVSLLIKNPWGRTQKTERTRYSRGEGGARESRARVAKPRVARRASRLRCSPLEYRARSVFLRFSSRIFARSLPRGK